MRQAAPIAAWENVTTQPKTSRPFEQRFLDGYGRSDLRQEVQKVKPSRFARLRRKYATWALGASLAFGGLGVPMKIAQPLRSESAGRTTSVHVRGCMSAYSSSTTPSR